MDPVQHDIPAITMVGTRLWALDTSYMRSRLVINRRYSINSVSFSRADVSAISVTDYTVVVSGSLWDVVR